MQENTVAFIVWLSVAAVFVIMGIAAFFSKKPASFWANVKQFDVNDLKSYNSSVGTLFIVYGIVFALLGLPILSENEGMIIISILGAMLATIAIMGVYLIVITPKFEKKQ